MWIIRSTLSLSLIFAFSCAKTSKGSRSSGAVAVNGTKQANEAASVDQKGVGKVQVSEKSFSEAYNISIGSVGVADFATKANLKDSSVIASDHAVAISVTNDSGSTLFPKKPISFSIDLGAGKELDANYFVLIVGKDKDGNLISNYVAKGDLEVGTSSSGNVEVKVSSLYSGSFTAAVINGDPKTVLGKNAVELGDDGKLVATTESTVAKVPTHAPTSMSFTDSNASGSQLTGTLTIAKASDESDVTSYKLYWGNDVKAKISSTPFATINATGSNPTYNFSNTSIPTGAMYVLVYSANATGEMASAINLLIIDLGVPTHAAVSVAFTDTDGDGGQIEGDVDISKASDETDVTHYVLYWGRSSTLKQSTTPIATLPVAGAIVTHTFAANTAVPTSPAATHLLVYTLNAEGEMATGVSVALHDVGLPVHAATSVSFTDTDIDAGEVAGNVTIAKASNESDITDYVLYWGSDATTKQDPTEIATLPKTGSNLSYSIPANTAIPTGPAATHLLVFTKNADGEMSTPVAHAIVDVGVPVNAATSVAFTDTDNDGGELQGDIDITIAADESDLTEYVLYWGSSSTVKQSSTPIATLTKTGSNLTHTFAASTPIPSSPAATHLLVYTKNADGEMATGVNVAIVDAGVPTVAAVSVGFTDTDPDGGEIGGNVSISKASNESGVTHYVIYWGSDATTKQNPTAIAQVAKTGSNLTYALGADTAIPTGPAATHLLVFTMNADGEMATGVSVAITDLGVPVNAPASVAFTDADLDAGEISGTVTITKAATETDLTHYVLYWGSNSTTKQSSTPIATIAKTGSNVTHNFTANTPIPSSPAATHLLVFTKNADGEMATGVNVAITDKGLPLNEAASIAFTDTDLDGGQIGGNVTITKATSEADVTHYVLYWGSNSTTKQNATPIANIAVTGSNVTHTFGANTAIPNSPTATHLLVYTKNADGEMSTGKNVAIVDKGVPVNAAASVAFTDTDDDNAQIAGTVTITKATTETDLTHYVLYWGSDATTKQNATPIATIAKTGSNVTYNISANTSIPTGPTATHLLVFTKNADGEMGTGVNTSIVDRSVPVNAAASVAFTDTDTDAGQVAGTVTITKATSESDVTHYVLYWGSNSTTKQNATPITNIAVTGANVTYNISANTAIPNSPTATHLLVYTKNAIGEMPTGVNVAITDNSTPAPLSQTRSSGGVQFVAPGDSWVDGHNLYTVNGNYAYAFLNTTCESQLIRFASLGFTIPNTATITGVEAVVTRRGNGADVTDQYIRLYNGSTSSNNKADTNTIYPTSFAARTYGSDSDTWGMTLDPTTVNSVLFSVEYSTISMPCSGVAFLDHIGVTVYYQP